MKIAAELEQHGILLKTDPKLPNACALVVGEPIRGSWWAHAKSHEIFGVLTELEAHPDVLVAKLVSGKDTFIHRSLWAAVLAVGTARERWQMHSLDREARALLAQADKAGMIESGGRAALVLERALLVHSEQVHTDHGSHAKILTSWKQWAERTGTKPGEIDESKASLEKLVDHLNARYQGNGRLPWRVKRPGWK
jgi:hypothetical protein